MNCARGADAMTRTRIVWVIVAVLGILSGLSVPRAQTQSQNPSLRHHVEANPTLR
jgi:hypothetical protein